MNSFLLASTRFNKKLAKAKELKVIFQSKDWKLYVQNNDYVKGKIGDVEYISFGDLVNFPEIGERNSFNIHDFKGHFYLFFVKNNDMRLYNSMFSILPVYYRRNPDVISNSLSLINDIHDEQLNIDKVYLLETLLFNYAVSNRTINQRIKLLDCNSFIQLHESSFSIKKHTKIEEYFINKLNYRKNHNELSDCFINICKEYFPDEQFAITLTGGFDGRTLTSCASHFKKEYSVCSFGVQGSDDVEIPLKNAKELNITYNFINLQEPKYIEFGFNKFAHQIIDRNPIFNGYLYPHFCLLANKVSKKNKYLISGLFGSELFRALHMTGSFISNEFIQILLTKDKDKIKQIVYTSPRLAIVKTNYFIDAFQELVEDLIQVKELIPNDISINQQLYYFIYEEVFRKLYGSIINSQMDYLFVRTPFLDFDFVSNLLKTEFAGVNNNFFTENPLKRLKGQLLYAEIIKKTNQIIYFQKTGKGYRASDLLEPLGNFKMLYPFFSKRFKRKVINANLDNLGIITSLIKNSSYFQGLLAEMEWLNHQVVDTRFSSLSSHINELDRDNLLQVLSFAYYLKGKRCPGLFF